MKGKNKKPTAFEIVELIIEAIVAISALITAIKWWQVTRGTKVPPPLWGVGVHIISYGKEFYK